MQRDEVFTAAMLGRVSEVAAALSAGFDPNAYDPAMRTSLLLQAVSNGQAEVVALLLDRGAHPNHEHPNVTHGLSFAAEIGRADICAMLLERGVDPDVQLGMPLFNAVQYGHLEAARTLLDAGAALDLMTGPEKKMALHIAASRGDAAMCLLLLERGALVDAQTKLGRTALMVGITFRATAGCELLLSYGANPNTLDSSRRSPLQIAADHGAAAIGRMLLDAGAEANYSIQHEPRAIERAAKKGDCRFVGMLLDAGVYAGVDERNPVSALMEAAYNGKHEVCQMLLERGCDPNNDYGSGRPPLQLAVSDGCVETCRVLIEGGADVNWANRAGETALHGAIARAGREKIAAFLVSQGASTSIVPEGVGLQYKTPFQTAIAMGKVELVRLLAIEGRENMEQKTLTGRTPLQLSKSREMREALRSLRASLTIDDAIGAPASDMVARPASASPL